MAAGAFPAADVHRHLSPTAPWFLFEPSDAYSGRRGPRTVATQGVTISPIWSRPTGTPSLSRGSTLSARQGEILGVAGPRRRQEHDGQDRRCEAVQDSRRDHPQRRAMGCRHGVASCGDRASGAAAVSQPHRRGEHSRRRRRGHAARWPEVVRREPRRCWREVGLARFADVRSR